MSSYRTGHGKRRNQTRAAAQVVRFYVGAQQYAVDIMRVKEIIEPVSISPMPHAPRFVEGIIELRSAYLAVIDLRKRFGVAAVDRSRDSKYVVVKYGESYLGMIVDRVLDVRRLGESEVEPAPELVRGADARFIAGVVTWDGEIAVILDLDALLSAEEIDSWRASMAARE